MSPQTPNQIGSYRLGDLLGSGGMGDVFRGFHERLKRPVAMKRIRDSSQEAGARRRLLFEAQTAARLNHPSIVQVYDILEHGGDDWIVMELVEGQTLRERLSRQGLPWQEAVSIARDVAEALAAAHSIGILHRDLKIENVLLIESGRAKLLDFGLAKDFQHAGDESISSLSAVGQVLGTPRSMSPEQARGETLCPRSDLFSLGVLIYECLTGTSPFRADTLLATLQRICNQPHESLIRLVPSTPVRLSRLVDRLLGKMPERRPESAIQVVRELERIAINDDAWSRSRGKAAAYSMSDQPTPSLGSSPTRPPIDHDETSKLVGLRLQKRRRITVLCTEIRGLEPDDFCDLLPGLRRRMSAICKPYEGALIRASGRRLIVAFGTSVAHEDDALRAVRVGMSWLRDMAKPNRFSDYPFAVVSSPSPVEADDQPTWGQLALDQPTVDQTASNRTQSDRAMLDRPVDFCVAIHAGATISKKIRGSAEEPEIGELLDEVILVAERAESGQIVLSDGVRALVPTTCETALLPRVRLAGRPPLILHRVKSTSGVGSDVDFWGRF